jgi:hypothetical protein
MNALFCCLLRGANWLSGAFFSHLLRGSFTFAVCGTNLLVACPDLDGATRMVGGCFRRVMSSHDTCLVHVQPCHSPALAELAELGTMSCLDTNDRREDDNQCGKITCSDRFKVPLSS